MHCKLTISKTWTFTDRLPSPESVHIKEHFNSSTIEWKPPYSAMNNESDSICVNPHIIQYTVYITDNYTGDVVKDNVTETQFSPNIQQVDDLCPMYQVSAWNSGGEGEVSEPVQESTPRGKQAKDVLDLPTSFTVAIDTQTTNFLAGLLHYILFVLFCISIPVPRNVTAESITVRGTVKPNFVHIRMNNVSS